MNTARKGISFQPGRYVVLLLLVAFSACTDDVAAPDDPEQPVDELGVSDAAHGGEQHFYFLPPLVTDPDATGTFDPSFLPYLRVEVCESEGSECQGEPIATFKSDGTTASEAIRIHENEEYYVVNWNPAQSGASAGETYRISVSAHEVEFGFLNVRVVNAASDKSSKLEVVQGANVSVNFRIEQSVQGASVIGAKGGGVISQDENLVVDVPSDALEDRRLITVVPSSIPLSGFFASRVVDHGYTLKPNGLDFAEPVSLAWFYDDAASTGIDPAQLLVVRYREDDEFPPHSPTSRIIVPSRQALLFELSGFSQIVLLDQRCPKEWCVFFPPDVENPESDNAVKWSSHELEWSLEEVENGSLWGDRVEEAFAQWENATNGALTFKRDDGQPSADAPEIILKDPQTLDALGSTDGPDEVFVELARDRFLPEDQMIIRISSEVIEDEANNPAETAFRTLRHEIGHAIGIAHPKAKVGCIDLNVGSIQFDLICAGKHFTARAIMQKGEEPRPDLHQWDKEAARFLYPTEMEPTLHDRIAFSSKRESHGDLYYMEADGSSTTRLTTDGEGYQPSISSDGTKIAFWCGGICVINADGSDREQVTPSLGNFDLHPDWSPDDSRIVFQSQRDGDDEIYTVNPDGTDLRQVTDNAVHDGRPAWSPDGERIAFQSSRSGGQDIYTVKPDGTGLVQVTDHPTSDLRPAWSPDGSRIVFEGFRSGEDIWTINSDGTGLDPLIDNAQSPAWSPDGSRIAFVSDRDGDFDIWTINLSDGSLLQLTDAPGSDTDPDWGP